MEGADREIVVYRLVIMSLSTRRLTFFHRSSFFSFQKGPMTPTVFILTCGKNRCRLYAYASFEGFPVRLLMPAKGAGVAAGARGGVRQGRSGTDRPEAVLRTMRATGRVTTPDPLVGASAPRPPHFSLLVLPPADPKAPGRKQ